MLKKLASIVAMVSASLTVASCQTAMYKPIICEPGTALKNGRCQKVPPIEKRTDLTPAPKKKVIKKNKPAADGPGIIQPPRRQQNVYGQPQ